MKYLITVLVILMSAPAAVLAQEDDSTPSIEIGAKVFIQRCVLCHGNQAMGEGAIPLRIKGYPNTNLITANKVQSQQQIHDVIAMGALLPGISEFMPPMGNELTWTELESVSMFLSNLRQDPKQYLAKLKDISMQTQAIAEKKRQGELIFQSRCVLCHGPHGEGNGRMAKVIKTPPPFDLTKSVMPPQYLAQIISKGGEALNRSGQMPPWGDQLNENEIEAVVNYIVSLRRQ